MGLEDREIVQDKELAATTGCLLVLDIKALKLYTVRMGSSAVAVGRLVHGMASQLTEGTFAQHPSAFTCVATSSPCTPLPRIPLRDLHNAHASFPAAWTFSCTSLV